MGKGISWWLSGLRIQCCYCCGSGSILGPETSACHGHSQKKRWAKDLKTFMQRRYSNAQQVHEKISNITNQQGNVSSGKCRSKPQRDTTAHLLEWLLSKKKKQKTNKQTKKQRTSVGKDVEIFCTVGGKVNCCRCYRKQYGSLLKN